jgi:hypothetical protein
MDVLKIDRKKLDELKEELERYVQKDGSEVGEAADIILAGLGYEAYIGDECFCAMVLEAEEMLANFQINYIWKERSRTITEDGKSETKKWYELELIEG